MAAWSGFHIALIIELALLPIEMGLWLLIYTFIEKKHYDFALRHHPGVTPRPPTHPSDGSEAASSSRSPSLASSDQQSINTNDEHESAVPYMPANASSSSGPTRTLEARVNNLQEDLHRVEQDLLLMHRVTDRGFGILLRYLRQLVFDASRYVLLPEPPLKDQVFHDMRDPSETWEYYTAPVVTQGQSGESEESVTGQEKYDDVVGHIGKGKGKARENDSFIQSYIATNESGRKAIVAQINRRFDEMQGEQEERQQQFEVEIRDRHIKQTDTVNQATKLFFLETNAMLREFDEDLRYARLLGLDFSPRWPVLGPSHADTVRPPPYSAQAQGPPHNEPPQGTSIQQYTATRGSQQHREHLSPPGPSPVVEIFEASGTERRYRRTRSRQQREDEVRQARARGVDEDFAPSNNDHDISSKLPNIA
ncbi:hypothetical protein NA57DRAFT_79011 [Rhizodiscina lignyota]|uniref:Uncharacterized protein n=1 Tax=Rhizodiscina lignyota TaxID=1504668 RepID=A0A9P4IC60_9PEZI|nr:hypothetical protein NA57DRAFT_79011 [Rhizodiscina lignyota]